MLYIIYKVTNLLNNKIYIGLHKTENENDSYMGSGKLIQKALKKYDENFFLKEILYRFDNLEAAIEKERELVNEEFVARSDTYNMCVGGGLGGKEINGLTFKDKNHSEQTKKKISLAMKGNKHSAGRSLTEEQKQHIGERSSKVNKDVSKTPEHKRKIAESVSLTWKNQPHRFKRIKNKEKRTPFVWITDGQINKRITPENVNNIPQGWVRGKTENTVWITDGTLNKKIRKTEVVPEGWRYGRVM